MTIKATFQCPECNYGSERRRGALLLPCHAMTCSRIDLESAKYYCRKLAENGSRWQRNCIQARQYATLWEGKFRVVTHENNQLRKKLHAIAPKEKETGGT